MNTPVEQDVWALTEREKQTLRLMVRGHDAKSIARSLGLSVHTINERLRDARRKMAVSSSREAARLLLDAESGDTPPPPDSSGDMGIGADAAPARTDQEGTPIDGADRVRRPPPILVGAIIMTLALGLLALAALPQTSSITPAPATSAAISDPQAVDTARGWLALLDQARWDESYRLTGSAFRTLNTVQAWTAASETARAPLGAMLSRTFVSQENLPAPPAGYEVMKFRTRFANRAEAVETVTLDREAGAWRVVGVTIG